LEFSNFELSDHKSEKGIGLILTIVLPCLPWQEKKMKKDLFILELVKSFPFRVFLLLVIIIVAGVAISKCKEKKVQMKEDILYVHPKPSK
jgi:hypothetical protein